MNFDFDTEDLCKLYETGKTRKLTLPDEVYEKLISRLESLFAADSIKDIENDVVMDLKRNKKEKNLISMRLVDGWRLEADLVCAENSDKIDTVLIKNIIQP